MSSPLVLQQRNREDHIGQEQSGMVLTTSKFSTAGLLIEPVKRLPRRLITGKKYAPWRDFLLGENLDPPAIYYTVKSIRGTYPPPWKMRLPRYAVRPEYGCRRDSSWGLLPSPPTKKIWLVMSSVVGDVSVFSSKTETIKISTPVITE